MSKAFKIAKIISQYKVVVNAGTNDSIREDQVLEVFEPGQEIIDPDTKMSLGTLDYVKAKLRVVDVFPLMCVCENRDGEIERTIAEVMTPRYTERLALDVDSKEISGGFEHINKKIRVGDLVRTRR